MYIGLIICFRGTRLGNCIDRNGKYTGKWLNKMAILVCKAERKSSAEALQHGSFGKTRYVLSSTPVAVLQLASCVADLNGGTSYKAADFSWCTPPLRSAVIITSSFPETKAWSPNATAISSRVCPAVST
jgi:hypothetical protein